MNSNNNVESSAKLDIYTDSPLVGKYATIIRGQGYKVLAKGFIDRLVILISVPAVNAIFKYESDLSFIIHYIF